MGKIWLVILLSSISALLFTNPKAAMAAMLSGSEASLKLAMQLVAMYGFWLGFFAILEKTGISDLIAKILRPIIKRLFKGSSEEARKYIAMNMSANLLGLGNAATPMGIKSVELLGGDGDKANDNIKMLVVISSTSLQLLPSTVISMRINHGSNFPTSFLGACIAATVTSTLIGIALCKLISKLRRKSEIKSKRAIAPAAQNYTPVIQNALASPHAGNNPTHVANNLTTPTCSGNNSAANEGRGA